jgi:hypothetical protein
MPSSCAHVYSHYGRHGKCDNCDAPRPARYDVESKPVRLAKSRLPKVRKVGELERIGKR